MTSPETLVFDFGSDIPADLLVNAAAVTHFLMDVSDALNGDSGLSEDGAHGLLLILSGIENTINKVVTRL